MYATAAGDILPLPVGGLEIVNMFVMNGGTTIIVKWISGRKSRLHFVSKAVVTVRT